MACLDLSLGAFTPVSLSTILSGTAAGKAVSLTPASGLSVSGTLVLAPTSGFNLSAAILGGQFLVALQVETAPLSQRRVYVVDLTAASPVARLILVVSAPSSVTLPVIQASPGSQSLLAVWAPDGPAPLGQILGASIVRADNGTVLLPVGAFTPTAVTQGGEVTATQLLFKFHSGGSPQQAAIPRPAGAAVITSANPQTFGSVPIGGCPVTPPTRTYTIRNSGTDCLTINPFAASGPYTVTSTSRSLPVSLDPGQTVDVVVRFNPTAIGSFNNVNLPVTPQPPNGPVALVANGSAVAAAPALNVAPSSTLDFGRVPNGTPPSSLTLTLTNAGTAPLALTATGGSASGFSWTSLAATLTCGASTTLTVTFAPTLPAGPKTASFSITPAVGAPITITLLADVCVPTPLLTAPPTAPIDFGEIERGFQTVRLLSSVQNPGSGPLTFTAEIVATMGAAPATTLFGILDPAGGSLIPSPSRTFTVLPTSPCGGTAGPGSLVVPVAFNANQPPGVITGVALRISSTNPAFSRDYHLTATILPPIPLDAALVIDRSGSMADPLGSRRKIDAAISAGQLFVELLRPDLDDRVALVRFSTSPEVVQGITPVVTAPPPSQSDIRTQVAAAIPPAAGFTGITGGTLLGIQQVNIPRPIPPTTLRKAVVVLTDGIENRAHEDPSGSGNWFTLLGGPSFRPDGTPVSTSPAAFPADVQVFAVGLGRTGEVSEPQLNALSTPPPSSPPGSPPASPFRVNQDLSGLKYFELEKRFTQIYMGLAGVAPIVDPMYWIGPGETQQHDFEVLRGDVNVLVVIYDWEGQRLPFFCRSPKGEILDPVSLPPGFQLRAGITPTARVVEIKMPKAEPNRYAGTWQVVIQHPKQICYGELEIRKNPREDAKQAIQGMGFISRRGCKKETKPLLYGIAIGVGSNFRMQPYVTPSPVYVGEPIQLSAVLSEAGLPIIGATVTVRAESPTGVISDHVLKDDGAHGDSDPDDGEYGKLFTATPVDGVYHFTFRAEGRSREGKTVVREAIRDKEVLRKGLPPGGNGPDGSGRPGGDSPNGGTGDACCEKLLDSLREQTELLRQIAYERN